MMGINITNSSNHSSMNIIIITHFIIITRITNTSKKGMPNSIIHCDVLDYRLHFLLFFQYFCWFSYQFSMNCWVSYDYDRKSEIILAYFSITFISVFEGMQPTLIWSFFISRVGGVTGGYQDAYGRSF